MGHAKRVAAWPENGVMVSELVKFRNKMGKVLIKFYTKGGNN